MEHWEAKDEARLSALREAAQVGIADIEAGRSRVFESGAELQEYLSVLTAEVLESGARPAD